MARTTTWRCDRCGSAVSRPWQSVTTTTGDVLGLREPSVPRDWESFDDWEQGPVDHCSDCIDAERAKRDDAEAMASLAPGETRPPF